MQNAGDELCFDYGRQTASKYLLHYGFIPEVLPCAYIFPKKRKKKLLIIILLSPNPVSSKAYLFSFVVFSLHRNTNTQHNISTSI
jgi:hypothetical protein